MKYPASILLLFSLTCCSASAIAQKSLAAEKIIRELEEQRREASINNDTTSLAALFAPEFYEIGRFGKFRTKAQNMMERANGKLRMDSLTLDSIEVKVFGNVAIATGITRGKGLYAGMPFEQQAMRYSRIYLYRKKRWQIIFGQNTPIVNN